MIRINTLEGYSDVKDSYFISKDGFVHNNGRVLKNSMGKWYYRVNLSISPKKYKTAYIHRLVALAYIPNSDVLLTDVNHIDEDKTNNSISNLEWVTKKQNANHGTRNYRISKNATGVRDKPVEYYKTNPVFRYHFKARCKKVGWSFDDFKETFAEWHHKPSGERVKKFFYKNKKTFDKSAGT